MAGADSVCPPPFDHLDLPSYSEMCEDLAAFGMSASSGRHGGLQHFGAYILDMLYTVYAAERGIVRESIQYKACSNCPEFPKCVFFLSQKI
eukprot:6356200-Amphidinium_carterae.1